MSPPMIELPRHSCLNTPQVTRFAPSPTGYLHLGHAYSAAYAKALADQSGGQFLVRIEDIDRNRSKLMFETAIYEDLGFLGLAPSGPVLRQSDRMTAYGEALAILQAKELTYPCFCTRAEITREMAAMGRAPHGPDGPPYPGTCKKLSADERAARIASGELHAIRVDLDRAMEASGPLTFDEIDGAEGHGAGTHKVDPFPLGDVVIARKDVPVSYHLSVVVDDAFQTVTLVTRGADLFFATPIHRLLQALLGLAEPLYAHHRLIRDGSGRRLAKRADDLSIRALREQGESAEEVLARLP